MSGNVWEWCQDRNGAYPSGPVTDPTGPASSNAREIRGGGWDTGVRYLRSAYRSCYLPGNHSTSLGFRLVMHVK